MQRLRRWCGILYVAPLVACATAPAPPPLPPPPVVELVPAVEPYPFSRVYTAAAGVTIRGEAADSTALQRAFVPLNVLGRDTLGLIVRCPVCEPPVNGRVQEKDVVHTSQAPAVAALGSLGQFALSVMKAAATRDVEALKPVMAEDFFFSFVGSQTPDAAAEVWRSEGYASLDQVPNLLAEGLGSANGKIWAAPRRYVETLGYRGLRLGFRQRPDGRWEWLYLVRGIAE